MTVSCKGNIMKNATLLVLLLYCGAAAAAETIGATLHRASLRDWHQATSGNQFATVADIVEKMSGNNDHLTVAPKARDVQACINQISANFSLRSQTVFDTAIACMAKLGYLPRR